MTGIPAVLTDADLPLAERMAARLDGELFPIDTGHCAIDQPDTPELRLAAVLAGRPPRYIADLGTAAWVWHAAARPQRIELCVALGARARLSDPRGAVVREVVIAAHELRRLGGRHVTSPLRTAMDFARVRERFGPAEVATVRRLAEVGGFGLRTAIDALERRPRLPGRRRAVERLGMALGGPDAGALSRR